MIQEFIVGIIVGICVWVAVRMIFRRFRSRQQTSCDCGCGGCARRESCDSEFKR